MISLIVALDRNKLIGSKGNMPWGKSIKPDLEWFKLQTSNKIVIMGRKTFESIGKPLSNRINVILTKDDTKDEYYQDQICYVAHSVEEVLNEWVSPDRETFIIGGSEIYKQFLPLADRLYITHIDHEFEGDTYFPEYDLSDFCITYERYDMSGVHPLRFVIYEMVK